MVPNGRPLPRRVRNNVSETMAKKKTKLTAEFWRKDAEQRANADRILAILRKEREAKRGAA